MSGIEETKRKRILIVALGNEFDIVMFTGIFRTLRNSGKAKVTLLVRNTARAIVPFIGSVDRALFFDEKKIRDRVRDGSYSLVEKYQYLRDYLSELISQEFDLAVNLSHCTTGACVINILSAKEKIGFHLDEENRKHVNGGWMQAFFASVNDEKHGPYSFYDMIGAQFSEGGTRCLPFLKSDDSLDAMCERIRNRFDAKGNELFLISCASSLDEKERWNLDSVVKLANHLAQKGGKVIVFSGSSGVSALRNVESYVDKAVTCEVMSALDLILFARYAKVVISQSMPALTVPSAMRVPIICISINEGNFREGFPCSEGCFIVESKSTDVDHDFIAALVESIDSKFVQDVIDSREEIQDIPVEIPENIICHFSRFDSDGFLTFDTLEKCTIDRDGFYLQLYREMWKVLLCDKVAQEAFNDYVTVLKNNFKRNDILASISFARYDIGTVELFQQQNKENLEILGSIINGNCERERVSEVEKTNREILLLFNRNPFLTAIKFYFLILHENVKKQGAMQQVKDLFEMAKKLDLALSFIVFCLNHSSETLFEDFNVLDEVIGGEGSMIYH